MITPAFAQSEVTVSCSVRAGCNGCPDLVFNATRYSVGGIITPEANVIINVMLDGFSEPFYSGKTDSSGTLVLTGVPAGNYTWFSSVPENNGNVTINSWDYPIEASERAVFWLWFMAFKSNATDGEKGRYLLQTLANYFGSGEELPPKGSSNNETAIRLIPWIQDLEEYVAQHVGQPTLGAVKLTLYTVKSVLGVMAEMKPATEVYRYFLDVAITREVNTLVISPTMFCYVTEQDYQEGRITFLESKRVFDVNGAGAALLGIFLACLDLATNQPDVNATVKADDLEEHWVSLQLNLFKDIATIGKGIFDLAKNALIHFNKIGLSESAGWVAKIFGVGIGFLIIAGAIWDYFSRYGFSPFWEHMDDWHVWADMLAATSGGAFVASYLLPAALSYLGLGTTFTVWGTTISVALACTVVGVVLGIIVLVLTLVFGWNPPHDTDLLETQLSVSLTNMFRIRDALYALNTTQLEEASNQTRIFAGYAHEYAQQAEGEFKIDFENAENYLLRVSEAQDTYGKAVVEAREPLDNLIKLHLNYSDRVVGHLVGINSTKAEYNGTVRAGANEYESVYFPVNASLCYYHPQLEKYCFDIKNVTSENLNGTLGTEDYSFLSIQEPYLYQIGWAWDTPAECAYPYFNDDQFAVTYNITDTVWGNYFNVDYGIYNTHWYNYSNWGVQNDSGTFFLYKYYFEGESDDDALNDWLNGTDGINGYALTNATQKLNAVQDAAKNLTFVCTHPKPPETPSTPSGSTVGWVSTTYTYNTTTTDPNNDDVKYTFLWGDGSTNTTEWYNSGANASASHSWDSTGIYYVSVQAQDIYGLNSNISSNLTVEIYPRYDLNRDGIVDLFDLVSVGTAFDAVRIDNYIDPHYGQYWHNPPCPHCPHNPNTDIVEDGIIDIYDLVAVGNHFDETYNFEGLAGSSSSSMSGEMQMLLGDSASVSVYPSQVTVRKDETFSVDITVSNVADMHGWELKLYWNNAILNCTSAQVYVPTGWSGKTFEAGNEVENTFNTTNGRYCKALAALHPAPAFNGSMTIAKLTFKAKAAGTTALDLQETKLCNNEASAILHSASDGSVTVYNNLYVNNRFMRGDQQTVNGLTAYKLATAQSSTAQSYSTSYMGSQTVYWGIRVWLRHADGSENEVTSGTPVAQVSRSSNGYGIQSSTWVCPFRLLASTDAIVVRVYIMVGPYPASTSFVTEQLGALCLYPSTWTVYYYTKRTSNQYSTTGYFYWGTQTYNSRIENLQYTK